MTDDELKQKLEDIKDSFIEAVTPTDTNKYGAWFLKGVTIFLLLLIVYRAFA